MKNQLAIAAALLFSTAALAQTATVHSEEAAIIRTETQFEQARGQKGLEGWLSFFADDTLNIAGGVPIAPGKVEMRARLLKTWNNNELLKWQPKVVQVAKSHDLAWSSGTWQIYDKTKPNSAPIATGKYLTAWRKEKDGSWKVMADVGTVDPPPAKP